MRVLHIIKNFDFGGAENHVCELANYLDENGHNVFIVAGEGRQINRLNKGIRFISLKLRDTLIPLQVIIICFITLRNRIRIIHAHQRLPILIACIVGKLTGVPVVVTVHGRTSHDLRSWISQRYSEKIIFVSRHVLEVSDLYESIKHKSVIIPNAISVSHDRSEKLHYSISYISRIDKNHSSVILMMIQKVMDHLVSRFPMITFNIIGEGDFLPEIREAAIRLNSELNKKACVICGFIPEVNEIIRRSELVMGVGRVALEAMACGIPVLSINQKRMGTLISTDNYSFYKHSNFVAVENNAPDVKSLIGLLDSFFTDLGFWQKESLILQGFVNEDFNTLKTSAAIGILYDEIIKS